MRCPITGRLWGHLWGGAAKRLAQSHTFASFLKSNGTKKQKEEIDKFIGNIGSAEFDKINEVKKISDNNKIEEFVENNKEILPRKNIDNFDDFHLDSDTFEEI